MASGAAEDTFKRLLSGASAVLSSEGFTKRGKAFRHLSGENCAIIEFQRSQTSSSDTIRFTLNVGVVAGRLLADFEPNLAKAGAMDAHLRRRIGSFLAPPTDKWWDIDAGSDAAALLEELERPLRLATRYLLDHVADEQLIRLWESGESPGLTEGQRERNLRELKAVH